MINLKLFVPVMLRVVTLFTLAFILLVGMQSCQKEETVIVEPPQDEVMTTESPVYSYLLKTAMHDGSYDNILDQSSCTSIELPVTVLVDGIEITLDSEEDLILIEKIFDEFDGDIDELDFIFPITIVLTDHSEIVIENAAQLEDIINGCDDGDIDDDIECVDFVYPIKLSIYNSENQVSDVVVIEDDGAFHHFLKEMEESDLVGIQFPVTLLLSDGTEVTANDNIQLNSIIEDAKDDCDEDDDNDHNDDDADDTDLKGILIEGKWFVYDYVDETDVDGLFDGYVFNFFENGEAVAYNDQYEIHGEWASSGHDGILRLELFFGEESPFDLLHEDWKVLEFNGDALYLKVYPSVNDIEKKVTFKRPEVEEPELKASDVLPEGEWLVARFDDSGENRTELFNDYLINFGEHGDAFAERGDDIAQGYWEEEKDGDYYYLTMGFGDHEPFFLLNDTWKVISVREDRVEVRGVSESNSEDILVFEK